MYKDRKVYLCAFHNLDLYLSAIRFKKQAESFNIFDEIFIYNEYNLPYNEKFEKAFRSKLVYSRGFGYWCWKPFIVLKTLESMNDNDILVYADIGCHFNKEGIDRFYEYLDLVIDNSRLCFKLGLNSPEKKWTKSDLFNYLNVLNNQNITDTPQIFTTYFLFLKNSMNIEFLKKWLQVYYDDFSLADDSPSKIKNADIFIENRHDQSIFSILSKIYNFYTISENEFESKNKIYPIIPLRDKKNIYDIIYLDEFKKMIKKLGWFISIRKLRDNFRNSMSIYYINSLNKYLGNELYNDISITGIKIIDNYLKLKIDNMIKLNIKDYFNYKDIKIEEIKESLNYILKYKND
ncbi:hypothetical protein OFR22_12970 [Brachyspira hyodysenteriae]|uniref:Glycosyl transferase n=1 Tax=Brachyspira hyodysenteriae ATCC 27164 TaxID=1266923 RepID=A0A3B6VP48_BRAHO|nr:hypothetical protein [Brachyspira hyodysenteriae]ANN62307.1 hypothetical protein BHYOB78_00090 [Brachyspira hyodysenteriae ATCC 27164]KLI15799.1 hypothetical protein SU45_09745 [Brachyspira hyodysenteriae]KLI23591.1 hypothetical protein SZ47_11290 [Brachyspira hyodysenteriae]KLI38363.1 hypothetical protein SZ52_12425 [Brachyspira hyodysenteriae]KLI56649.1 hypothetical protein SZ46_14190 [Brachyspira hyodysenteriae]